MSEEILKALMQLFAIIAKQDEGVELTQVEYVKNFLQQQLREEDVEEYFSLFKQYAELDVEENETPEAEKGKKKLTSVKDSVRILGLCKKINKTLTQKQKVVVLVRLFEIVNADRKFTEQRMAIINTVAEVFKVPKEEFESIELFVIKNEPEELDNPNILIINALNTEYKYAKKINAKELDTNIFILRIKSVDLYFLKYTGLQEIYLNGLNVRNDRIYLFASGSTVKIPKSSPIYYSDVVSHFLAETTLQPISFEVTDLEYRFPNGNIGVRNINIFENHGRLIGILGASGAGKTTLLNVLAGLEKPSNGKVVINGIDLHREKEKLEGVIGYVPQDDLLIEELTVFENLYYNAKLCFKDKSEEELTNLVNKTLQVLGLYDKKDLKVGSPFNKTISGGQRKRLNIALELIREPSIFFVDEPTSGLSSRDSENVMDLLRELSLKGKLIFVVIHQPSSEIYKMFDKVIILDNGGYMVYYGNPVEAIMYFKRLDKQINSEVGECPVCGNVNPELIFNILEARVVDEFGNYTDTRKTPPQKWEEYYHQLIKPQPVQKVTEKPPKNLNIPGWTKQFLIYLIRDLKSKISNKQYVILTLLEAPVLGFILSFIIRYAENPETNKYIYRLNENIHIYIFMGIIVALFLGLTLSAEEIFKDRKILKREAFLNLSRSSYLIAKIFILFLISAIQSLLFVLIGNTILEIRSMYFEYWLALFTTAAVANLMGLNISASFNSVVTIYIIIPLIMIPEMVLSGAMFSFDKLNKYVSRIDKVPLIAEILPTKWTYEALMVNQFKNNKYAKYFYKYDKEISQSDYKVVYWVPELHERVLNIKKDLKTDNKIDDTKKDLLVIYNEIIKENKNNKSIKFNLIGSLNPAKINMTILDSLDSYLEKIKSYYSNRFNISTYKKDELINKYLETQPDVYKRIYDGYYNEALADVVKKVYETNKILEYRNELVQHYDPVYQDPVVKSFFDFRAHFYSPEKHFMGKYFDTFYFNVAFTWLFVIFFYITLYFEWLKKAIMFFEKINKKNNK